MRSLRPYRWLGLVLTFAFLCAQGLGMAHAAQFGAEHSHDGVVCTVCVTAEDQDVLDAPDIQLETPAPKPALPDNWTAPDAPVPAGPQARAPPPRGPPAHSC